MSISGGPQVIKNNKHSFFLRPLFDAISILAAAAAMKATQNNNCNTCKWTLSSPLQRPTTVRALQPHTGEVSFITRWLVQCGSTVSSCVNRHLLHLLLASLHPEEKVKWKEMLVWQNINVFYPVADPCIGSLHFFSSEQQNCLRNVMSVFNTTLATLQDVSSVLLIEISTAVLECSKKFHSSD